MVGNEVEAGSVGAIVTAADGVSVAGAVTDIGSSWGVSVGRVVSSDSGTPKAVALIPLCSSAKACALVSAILAPGCGDIPVSPPFVEAKPVVGVEPCDLYCQNKTLFYRIRLIGCI